VQKAASFQDASADLRELAHVPLTPSYLQKLSLRIGQEWKDLQDAEVQAFRDGSRPSGAVATAKVAVVMVDGGRVQLRQDQAGRGVHERHWRESKVACLLTLRSPVHAVDPRPEPPKKFLDRVAAARLAAEIKSRGRGAAARVKPEAARPSGGRRRKRADGPKKLVRTVLASLACSEEFGWQVAAEVERRGLGGLERKGYICDGQKYNWSIYELHLQPWGFVAILDFLHLLGYLYGAAHAAQGKGTDAAWQCYERWLRWAWAGQVRPLLEELRAASARCGQPPRGCGGGGLAQATGGRRQLCEQQRQADGLPPLPSAGSADKQCRGGEHDQAGEPPREGEREVLGERWRRGDVAVAGGLSE
jgi:hypothetical protein